VTVVQTCALPIYLDGDVVDAEIDLHHAACFPQRLASPRHVGDDEMAAHRVESGRNGPYMKIVDGGHAGYLHELPFKRPKIDIRGRALHQDMRDLLQQRPSPWDNEQPNAGADDRVGENPALPHDEEGRSEEHTSELQSHL